MGLVTALAQFACRKNDALVGGEVSHGLESNTKGGEANDGGRGGGVGLQRSGSKISSSQISKTEPHRKRFLIQLNSSLIHPTFSSCNSYASSVHRGAHSGFLGLSAQGWSPSH